jgi:hypothetical protein
MMQAQRFGVDGNLVRRVLAWLLLAAAAAMVVAGVRRLTHEVPDPATVDLAALMREAGLPVGSIGGPIELKADQGGRIHIGIVQGATQSWDYPVTGRFGWVDVSLFPTSADAEGWFELLTKHSLEVDRKMLNLGEGGYQGGDGSRKTLFYRCTALVSIGGSATDAERAAYARQLDAVLKRFVC